PTCRPAITGWSTVPRSSAPDNSWPRRRMHAKSTSRMCSDAARHSTSTSGHPQNTDMREWRRTLTVVVAGLVVGVGLGVLTWVQLPAPPAHLPPAEQVVGQQVLAADGTPLNRSFRGRFNHARAWP